MPKIRYEVDPQNRLTIRGPGRFRQAVDGEFKLGAGNVLSYHIKKSDNLDVPQQIKFSGAWSLDEKNNLVLTLDKWNNQVEGNKLVLKGGLIAAGAHELVFVLSSRSRLSLGPERRGLASTRMYLMKFGGAWQADKNNRLCFEAEKETGASDILTLKGTWELNKNNEIVYVHKKTQLKTKEKVTDILTFRGHWDVGARNRISYVLDKNSGSGFDFKVGFEKAFKDSLRFGLSVGFGEKKKRTIALSGRWKVTKDTGLTFEVKQADKGVRLDAALVKTFLAGQGEGFIKTLISKKEYAVVAGAGFKW